MLTNNDSNKTNNSALVNMELTTKEVVVHVEAIDFEVTLNVPCYTSTKSIKTGTILFASSMTESPQPPPSKVPKTKGNKGNKGKGKGKSK